MANALKYFYGTEAQILALTPTSANWIELAFYYPTDKDYFYQALNGVMKKYCSSNSTSTETGGKGVFLNGAVIGGVKEKINEDETLEISEDFAYNTYFLETSGIINNLGTINIRD